MMNSSIYSQIASLEKANKIGMAFQFACQPLNNNLKNSWIQIY